jgi:lipopolysaccharide/colanic/teichoic acid biosynthesis glycosyltransferase
VPAVQSTAPRSQTIFLIGAQIALLAGSAAAAGWLRTSAPIGSPVSEPIGVNGLIVCAVLVYPVVFLLLSLYDEDRTFRAVDEFQILTTASLCGAVLTAFFVFFFAPYTSRLMLGYFYALEYVSLFSLHSMRRLFMHGRHVTDPRGRTSPLNGYQRTIKRVVDLVLSAVLLILAIPIFAAIALAIALDSRGPVFFRQERVGEGRRRFQIVKFRTMVIDAEARIREVEQPDANGQLVHKRQDDPRVTRVGRVLRRTSLDELPQLFNVIAGEMSLVGPRPELPRIVERYEPWQYERLSVPQGMTGWWQVNGRSDKPMHLNTQDDVYYVRHYSLLLDLQILLKTIWVVLRGKGAY